MITSVAGQHGGYFSAAHAMLNRTGILLTSERETEKTTACGGCTSWYRGRRDFSLR